MMECRSCGCTDQSVCPGGCIWVYPGLCSKCLPYDITFECGNGHEFTATMREDQRMEYGDGETAMALEEISCPECSSGEVIDQHLNQETVV